MFRAFLSSITASMSVLMMVMIGVAMFIAANVIDYISLTVQKSGLQGLADRAALAAAQELIVARASDERVTAVANAVVKASYEGEQTTRATVIDNNTAVRVVIDAAPRVFFNGPISQVESARAEAVAEVSGGGNVCMLGLDPTAVATLKMSNRSRLSAPECAIYSNSTSDKSLWLSDTSRVYADSVCVAGGVQGPETSFTLNQPTLDCPPLDDPLRNRPNPDVGDLDDCDYTNTRILPLQDRRLRPGVYCGGITVMGGRARLDPGIYVMRNGPLNVAAGRLEGQHVGFFMSGTASTIQFARLTSISLTAPRDGELAGMLFFEDRDTTFDTYHRITSQDARNLVGTIYLPKSRLLIDAANPVADRSDYTVIIAREFELRDGPELVLNTDYENSTIPVPEGLGNNTKTNVRLIE